ncbi:MAG: HAMP domain-containing histidine kinase [Thiobacillus sp.]|jgi:signal transduction histidine kinase|nr:HAMP domain-containing histidine kinase [Thiobacillus sp.]
MADSASLDLETRRLLLGLLVRHTPVNLLAYLIVGLLCTAYFVNETGDVTLWGWLAVQVCAIALRARWLLWVRPRLARMDANTLRRAERQAIVLVGISGLAWGSLVLLVFKGENTPLDFFTTATLVGMTGGAVTPLSSLRAAFPVYVLTILIPYVAKSLWIGTAVYLAGGLTVLAYMLVLLAYNRVTHRALWQAYRLQLEKEGLVAEQQALSRSRSLFLAGVSHDLRQPVQAMGMFNAYLHKIARQQPDPLGESLRSLADKTGLALASVNSQIGRLLELSRLEAGEVRPHRRAIRLANLFESTRNQQAQLASEKGLRLRFVATDGVVVSDQKMLQSILDNLVGNAVRYTSRGGVLIGARRRGDAIEIQVYDTGPGIPEERIPMLFEAYRRFDDTASDADVGHGLGLALVQRQAELLGHEVKVCSRIGKGSMFSVRLPLHTAG